MASSRVPAGWRCVKPGLYQSDDGRAEIKRTAEPFRVPGRFTTVWTLRMVGGSTVIARTTSLARAAETYAASMMPPDHVLADLLTACHAGDPERTELLCRIMAAAMHDGHPCPAVTRMNPAHPIFHIGPARG